MLTKLCNFYKANVVYKASTACCGVAVQTAAGWSRGVRVEGPPDSTPCGESTQQHAHMHPKLRPKMPTCGEPKCIADSPPRSPPANVPVCSRVMLIELLQVLPQLLPAGVRVEEGVQRAGPVSVVG